MATGTEISQLIECLVDDINSIRKENETHLLNTFNIFSAMRSHTDEVRLHSRFISSILDPTAPHGLGLQPLKEFLEICGIPDSILSESKLSVTPNYNEKKEINDIDILIMTKYHAIIVENKVNHLDTNYPEDFKSNDGSVVLKGQLERYYKAINQYGYDNKDIYVIYLTKDGHCPSDESVGQDRKKPIYPELKDKVISISYGHHVLQWLQRLKAHCENQEIVKYFDQYSEIVEIMTDSSSIEERKKLVKIIGSLSDDKKDVIHYLFENAKHILWHNADEFWHCLIKISQEKHNDVFYGLEWVGDSITDKSRFDSVIGNALNSIISDKKQGDFNAVYHSAQGATWYVTMDHSSDSLYFCVLDKYQSISTGKERKIPLTAINLLEDNNYEIENNYYWKFFTYKNENIKLSDQSCKQTIMLTQDNHRIQVVNSILDELRVEMDALDEMILSSNAQ